MSRNHAPICPYCGHEHTAWDECFEGYDEEEHSLSCCKCGLRYSAYMYFTDDDFGIETFKEDE